MRIGIRSAARIRSGMNTSRCFFCFCHVSSHFRRVRVMQMAARDKAATGRRMGKEYRLSARVKRHLYEHVEDL